MFETVATTRSRSRRLFIETLPVSIGLHAFAIAAFAGTTLWKVEFPPQYPRFVVSYSLTEIPEPPPPPPPPPPKVQPATEPQQQQPTNQPVFTTAVATDQPDVAPTVIPDTIPIVSNNVTKLAAMAASVPDAGPPGRQGGTGGGTEGGELGGDLSGLIGGIKLPDDGRVHVDLGAPLPLFAINQAYPEYPREMHKKGIEDSVIVRYIVGTDGRVRDVTVLDPAREKVFNEVTIEAIRRWRFKPMVKDGKRVEVVHDLQVRFELQRG